MGHLPELVEEERAAVRLLELSPVTAGGSGEGPLLVPEELALDERLRDGRAVDGDEGPLRALAHRVEGPGRELLARAARPRHVEHPPPRGGADLVVHRRHGRADDGAALDPDGALGEGEHVGDEEHQRVAEPHEAALAGEHLAHAGPAVDGRPVAALLVAHRPRAADPAAVAVVAGDAGVDGPEGGERVAAERHDAVAGGDHRVERAVDGEYDEGAGDGGARPQARVDGEVVGGLGCATGTPAACTGRARASPPPRGTRAPARWCCPRPAAAARWCRSRGGRRRSPCGAGRRTRGGCHDRVLREGVGRPREPLGVGDEPVDHPEAPAAHLEGAVAGRDALRACEGRDAELDLLLTAECSASTLRGCLARIRDALSPRARTRAPQRNSGTWAEVL